MKLTIGSRYIDADSKYPTHKSCSFGDDPGRFLGGTCIPVA